MPLIRTACMAMIIMLWPEVAGHTYMDLIIAYSPLI